MLFNRIIIGLKFNVGKKIVRFIVISRVVMFKIVI